MLKEKSLIENESQFKQFMSNYIESNDVDGFFSILLQQYTQESRLKAIQFAEQFLIKCSDYCKENGLKEESEALDKIFERKFSDDKAILVIYEFSLLIIFYFTHIDKNNILTIPKQLKNVRNDFAHLLGKLLSKACLQLAESIDNDTLTDDHIFLKYGFKINLKALSPILKDFASQISLEILEDFQKLIYLTTYRSKKQKESEPLKGLLESLEKTIRDGLDAFFKKNENGFKKIFLENEE